MHPDLRVLGPLEFAIRDTRFRVVMQDYQQHHTTPDEIIVLKPLGLFEQHAQVIRERKVQNLLELGIFEGGSAILFALLFEWLHIAAIDIRPPDPPVLDHLERLGLTERVRLCYGVSQDDRATLEAVITEEFGNEPVDMALDDASHQYELSRASFEILFPMLRPGGVHVIEDWAWSHWPGIFQNSLWTDVPALSNLAFELTMLTGSRPELVEKMEIRPGTIAVFKNAGAPPVSGFRLDTAFLSRGRRIALI